MPATQPKAKTSSNGEPHGWLGTDTVDSPLGTFEFIGGYPTEASSAQLRGLIVFNRAIETYLSQMPVVSWNTVWQGVAHAATGASNQVVIWERLMDAATLLLTGNTETVYALASIDLKASGPYVIEVPAGMLGGINDLWQHMIADIGTTGADHGKGGNFLILPPNHQGATPKGYLAFKSRTYRVSLGLRGFQADGRPDRAVAMMRSIKIYPLSKADRPPATTFVNGSGKEIDTIFADSYRFYEDLAEIVAYEPADAVPAQDKFALAAIGIEKGKPFKPNAERRALLAKAARLAGAMARVNSFASEDPERVAYDDRKWEHAFIGGSATWDAQGYINSDRRAAFSYIAIGMSPAMVEKHVGAGSQYLWTPRDAPGDYLRGSKSYRMRLPQNIPAKNFWSLVVYDAESRSLLRNGQPFPSVSSYTEPTENADGSIDIYFGPDSPSGNEKNWIKTVPGHGWFVLLRLYGPLEQYFDKTWRPGDIELLS